MPERYLSPSLHNNRRLPALSGNLTGVEAAIHDRIWNAIMDRKLRPGAKLHEDMVGNAFGVSRTIVRKVFLIMEQEGIIALPLNRGAFVATPSVEEVPPLFETARLIMPHILRKLVVELDEEDRTRLEQHFKFEKGLDEAQKARALRRLSQEHPILLADIHGNPILAALAERLSIRISLVLTLYQDPSSNRQSEHTQRINKAVLEGDAEEAVRLTLELIDLVEESLRFENPEHALDIGAILMGGDDEVYPKARRSSKPRGRKPKASVRAGAAAGAAGETRKASA